MLTTRFKNMTKRRLSRRFAFAVLVAISSLTGLGITLASGATTVPAPTITSAPPNPTNQTSAKFEYTDSRSSVTFQCKIDGSTYAPCSASGVTYTGLANGDHTFKVQAISSGKTSPETSYSWKIDTTPPTVTLAFPANKRTYVEAQWATGCPASPGVCGTAKDSRSVSSVVVSIRQDSGNWWGGSSFNKTSEFFNAATLASPGASTTGWSYRLPYPPDGPYTVHVRAADALGNTIGEENQLVATFNTDATPAPPTITSGPGSRTEATKATFTFTGSESDATFVCKLDGSDYADCKSPRTYTGLAAGSHTFYVKAKDGDNNFSAPATYSWTIATKGVEEQPFTISGNLSGALAPGVSQSLPLTITNPNGVQIFVTTLTVTPQTGSTKAGCDGPTNLQVTQSNVSATNPLTVPANGHVALPSGSVNAPQVLMKDLSTNQDACKGASFTFSYSGSAHS